MNRKTVTSRILEEEAITTTLPNFLVQVSYLNATWQRSTCFFKGGKSYTPHFKDSDRLFAYLTCPKLPACCFHVFCTPAKLNNYLVASIISQEFWICMHSHPHLQVSPHVHTPEPNSSSNLGWHATCPLKPFLFSTRNDPILHTSLLALPQDF